MKINELLDEVKNAKGLSSDGELGRELGIDKRRVSDYRKGERVPDEFACLKIAEALGKPLATVIATVKATSEKDETRRKVWENYMKRIGGLAASFAVLFFVLVTGIVTSPPAEAAPILNVEYCQFVLCKAKRKMSQLKSMLIGIAQKCTFGVFVVRIAQMPT